MSFKAGDRVYVKERELFGAMRGTGTIVKFGGTIIDKVGSYYVRFDHFKHYDDTSLPEDEFDNHSVPEEYIRHLTPLEELL